MTFIILFEDDAQADPDIRKTYMPAHLDFLEAHSGCDSIRRTAFRMLQVLGRAVSGSWMCLTRLR
ncbi:hypothetical protein [Roseobacter sp.]|uniref:hypothetical protein n=1 Tax=Roseobacter sp. TaxID=1907202 RepID=UPI0029677AC6|nr:hypothetical protein [Roseobacter sp.]MDW3182805.1 hypothetical protein [Roseobacter sp.]